MNKATLGALAMVLVGSVTFSFTNALLTDHSTKKRVQTHDTTNLSDQKLADNTNQTDKTVTDPIPTPEVKEVQTAESLDTSVTQAELNNGNMSEQLTAVNQNDTVKISSPAPITNTTASTNTTVPKTTTPSVGTTSTQPAATSAPPNLNTAPTATTSKVPVTTPAQPNSTTATTTNHGQQVAQAAKAKAASRQDKTVTN